MFKDFMPITRAGTRIRILPVSAENITPFHLDTKKLNSFSSIFQAFIYPLKLHPALAGAGYTAFISKQTGSTVDISLNTNSQKKINPPQVLLPDSDKSHWAQLSLEKLKTLNIRRPPIELSKYPCNTTHRDISRLVLVWRLKPKW